MHDSESVGIVGTGPIGRGLAALWGGAGHRVTLGARTAGSAKGLEPYAGVTIGDFQAAAEHDVVVLAVRHDAAESVIRRLAPALRGKLVISTMNAVAVHEGRIVSALPNDLTEGTWTASLLPESKVARAFSHVQDELLVSRPRRQPGAWAIGYAADDAETSSVVEHLVAGTGYVPVAVGTLAESSILDPGGAFFQRLLIQADAEGLAFAHRLPQVFARLNNGTIGDALHDDVRWTFPHGSVLGSGSSVDGKTAVVEHLDRVRDEGVFLSEIRTRFETPDGAIVCATGQFPTLGPDVRRRILSLVTTTAGRIRTVHQYWQDQAATL